MNLSLVNIVCYFVNSSSVVMSLTEMLLYFKIISFYF